MIFFHVFINLDKLLNNYWNCRWKHCYTDVYSCCSLTVLPPPAAKPKTTASVKLQPPARVAQSRHRPGPFAGTGPTMPIPRFGALVIPASLCVGSPSSLFELKSSVTSALRLPMSDGRCPASVVGAARWKDKETNDFHTIVHMNRLVLRMLTRE